MTELSDELLIKEYLGGNAESFGLLFERYKNRVFSYLLVLTRNREEAEDLFQEIFIKVIDKLPFYREENKFGPWLFTLARNAFLDSRKSSGYLSGKRTFSMDEPDADGAALGDRLASDGDPEKNFLSGEEARKIEAAFGRISPEQKEVIVLRHYGGMSFREISEQLGLPIGTVLARFSRGAEKLREALKVMQ